MIDLFALSGFWLKGCHSWIEWTNTLCWASQVWICCHSVSYIDSTSAGNWRWFVGFSPVTVLNELLNMLWKWG